ncbi:MAG: transcription antitermination factor NusB [Pricia sp.]
MLTRRHIRIKVMQCIYALTLSKDDSLEKQEKFLRYSIESMYNLYLLMLSLMMEIRERASDHLQLSSKKYLATASDKYPDQEKFVNNQLLLQLAQNESIKAELKKRKLKHWQQNDEYVKILYNEMVGHPLYSVYMSSGKSSYSEDRDFVISIYKDVIAPNEKIYDYFEDDKLTWVDDFPIVNTFIVKLFKKANENRRESFFLPRLLKDKADMDFAQKLLTKTLLNDAKWTAEIEGKTPNWDKDRIADMDSILLKMAICELLNFPTIPEKVTINEFLEIAKEYSTPKSSTFINGILDNLVREYKAEKKLNKIGRGLM